MSSISGISSNSMGGVQGISNAQGKGGNDKVKQAFDDLKAALESGDLSAAKEAYASLEKLKPKDAKSGQSSQNGNSSEMDKLMGAVGDALNSGDVSSAKEAFSKVQEYMKNNKPQGNMPPPQDVQALSNSSLNLIDVSA